MAPAIPLNTRSLQQDLQIKHVLLTLKRRLATSIHKIRSASTHLLATRQNGGTTDGQVGTIIPTTYNQQGGLAPGAVAGIVLGVVFGVLLFIIIVAWALQMNSGIEPSVDERIEVRDRAVSPSSRGHRRRRRRSGRSSYDMADVRVVRNVSPRRNRSTRIVEERIVEERRPNRSRASSIVVPVDEVYIDRRPRRGSTAEVVVEESDFSSEPRKKRRSKRRSR